MDLRALRYFVTAVNEGSISAAAKKCYVAQPSVTLAINKLEAQFHVQLLTRNAHGVKTTMKGRELYKMASDLLLHADAIKTKLSHSEQKLKLKLAIYPSIQVSYIQILVKASQALDANVEFELIDSLEQADILLCPQGTEIHSQDFYPITSERYFLLISNTNELAFKPELTLKDLAGQPLIERYHCENKALFERVIKHFDLNMPVVARVNNEEWALSLVSSGIGLSISPLPSNFSDSRFTTRCLSEISNMVLPERQIGFSLKASHSASTQVLLSELSKALTGSFFLKE